MYTLGFFFLLENEGEILYNKEKIEKGWKNEGWKILHFDCR